MRLRDPLKSIIQHRFPRDRGLNPLALRNIERVFCSFCLNFNDTTDCFDFGYIKYFFKDLSSWYFTYVLFQNSWLLMIIYFDTFHDIELLHKWQNGRSKKFWRGKKKQTLISQKLSLENNFQPEKFSLWQANYLFLMHKHVYLIFS